VLLQLAQVRRVRRADVDRDIVGNVVHRIEAGEVIRNRLFDRDAARLADVDAEDAIGPMPSQVISDSFSADVIEAEAIDQRAIFRQTKHARLGTSGLRFICDGADFDESKTERAKFADVTPVLIKACRQSDRVSKLKAESFERVQSGYLISAGDDLSNRFSAEEERKRS